MNYKKGSAHVIIISLLTLALVGALGWIFWQNFMQQKSVVKNSEIQVVEVKKDQTETSKTKEPTQQNYIEIVEWGVKFKAPDDGTKVIWAKYGENAIGFSTSKLKNNNAICNAEHGAAGMLQRSAEPFKVATGVTHIAINNGRQMGQYYYAYALPNGPHCENANPSDYDEAQRLAELTKTLALN